MRSFSVTARLRPASWPQHGQPTCVSPVSLGCKALRELGYKGKIMLGYSDAKSFVEVAGADAAEGLRGIASESNFRIGQGLD